MEAPRDKGVALAQLWESFCSTFEGFYSALVAGRRLAAGENFLFLFSFLSFMGFLEIIEVTYSLGYPFL